MFNQLQLSNLAFKICSRLSFGLLNNKMMRFSYICRIHIENLHDIYIYIHNRYYVIQKCIKCLLFMKCRTCFFVCILIVLLVLRFLITSQGQMSFLFLSMSPRPGQLGIFTLFGVRASQSQSPVIKVSRGATTCYPQIHKHIIHIYRIHYIVYIINPPAP